MNAFTYRTGIHTYVRTYYSSFPCAHIHARGEAGRNAWHHRTSTSTSSPAPARQHRHRRQASSTARVSIAACVACVHCCSLTYVTSRTYVQLPRVSPLRPNRSTVPIAMHAAAATSHSRTGYAWLVASEQWLHTGADPKAPAPLQLVQRWRYGEGEGEEEVEERRK
jgi:hypothetical protein